MQRVPDTRSLPSTAVAKGHDQDDRNATTKSVQNEHLQLPSRSLDHLSRADRIVVFRLRAQC